MKNDHWTEDELKAYFSGRMFEDSAHERLDHLAVCNECMASADDFSAGRLQVELWNTNLRKKAAPGVLVSLLEQSVSALEEMAAAETNPGLAERLRQWATTGQSWAAVRVEIKGDAIASTFENIPSLAIPDPLWLAEAVPDTGEVVRTRGSIHPRGLPRTEVSLLRSGSRVTIAISNLPAERNLLLALVPLDHRSPAQHQPLEFDRGRQSWIAQFNDVLSGAYTLLVEPPPVS
jgi:anti-sigma factor RsiW